ncbi:hypothetical protein D3C85_1523680 [compost metagenome]
MVRAVEIGSSTSSLDLPRSTASTGAGFSRSRPSFHAMKPEPSARAANGISGMPGIRPIRPAAPETTPSDTGLLASWLTRALSAVPSTPAFDTRKPAATETMMAGIWVTRPSPTVSWT